VILVAQQVSLLAPALLAPKDDMLEAIVTSRTSLRQLPDHGQTGCCSRPEVRSWEVHRIAGSVTINALMSINGVARGLSALRKLSRNGVLGDQTAQSAVNNIALPRSGFLDRNGFRVACCADHLILILGSRPIQQETMYTLASPKG
jgi:hypothetical protein